MFIDTHAHIYLDRFNEDFDSIINRAQKAKVNQILMPNIDGTTIESMFDRSSSYPDTCKPMVGLHPCSVSDTWKEDLSTLEPYVEKEGVVAVGEIGIDLYWDKSYKLQQEEAFKYQINWAKDRQLPIVIHSRAAIDITIQIVNELQDGTLTGVFHCFDQSIEHAQKIIDLGFYMGIGGICTYKKNDGLRETIANIPLSNIVLETDAPYLPPVPYRGKRNESSYIPVIANQLAEIYAVSIAQIAKTTTDNAIALFDLY